MIKSSFDFRLIQNEDTRIDRYMETCNGETVTPGQVSWIFDGDSDAALYFLKNWYERHPERGHIVSVVPYSIRVSNPENDKYNKAVHELNVRRMMR